MDTTLISTSEWALALCLPAALLVPPMMLAFRF
jgi:hypothetical protein